MNDDTYDGANTDHTVMSVDDDSHESIILNFCDITGCDIDSARHFLEVSLSLSFHPSFYLLPS